MVHGLDPSCKGGSFCLWVFSCTHLYRVDVAYGACCHPYFTCHLKSASDENGQGEVGMGKQSSVCVNPLGSGAALIAALAATKMKAVATTHEFDTLDLKEWRSGCLTLKELRGKLLF